MRIGLIAPPWFELPPSGYGGTERVVVGLATELTRRGHEVTTFAAPGSHVPGRVRSFLPEVPAPEALGDTLTELTHVLGAYREIGEFDVVHDHSGFVGAALASLLPAAPPVIHTLHGPWTDASRRFYGSLGSRVQLVAISRSQAAANPSVHYAGVVHNGLAPEQFPWRTSKEERLVWVGRANPDKGLVEAIEAARLVGMPLSVLVKVNEPAEREYWASAVSDLLDDDIEVIFNAGHEIKADRVSRAAAMVLPLQWEEPFGLVMIEALACGTPVVAFNRGSVSEIVTDGETGFVVDPAAGVKGIATAIANAGDLDGAQCRKRFEEHFSAAVMTDGYERIYRDAIRQRRTATVRPFKPSFTPTPETAMDLREPVSTSRLVDQHVVEC
ncbi:MAG: glycosyltransferase family 4 protein [Acidimicrobiales bacterium]|nr:glycosyltransferase family 4 protein [Acidimicrobiales bacterium]